MRLLRIEFDDELLLDVFRDVFTSRHVEELAGLCGFVPFDPGVFAVVESSESIGDNFE